MKWLSLAALLLCGCRGEFDLPESDAASPFPSVSWTKITGTPNGAGKSAMPIVPVDHALVGFGGVPHSDASTWSFSPTQGGWTSLSVATPPAGRDGHCAAPLPSGEVLLTGDEAERKQSQLQWLDHWVTNTLAHSDSDKK